MIYILFQRKREHSSFFQMEASEINPTHYEFTHFGTIPETQPNQALMSLFLTFNADDRPTASFTHSLSVNDIVILEDTAYLCQNFGWEKVDFPFEEEIRKHNGWSLENLRTGYIAAFDAEFGVEVIQKLDELEDYGMAKFESDTEAGEQALKDGFKLFTTDFESLAGWYIVDTPKNRQAMADRGFSIIETAIKPTTIKVIEGAFKDCTGTIGGYHYNEAIVTISIGLDNGTRKERVLLKSKDYEVIESTVK